MEKPEAELLKNLDMFIAFARKRVGDPHLAEDLVQDSLLKALQADRKPDSSEDVVAWFYRILRRSIIDLYRRNDVRSRALEKLQAEPAEHPDPQTEAEICNCFKSLMADMPQSYQELLTKIDLEGGSLPEVAQSLGETANNARVRLHRARKQLRDRVEKLCKLCSAHGCIDCDCDSNSEGVENI
jgi:RNA polymerase sigma factor (sigma-70 family)